MKLQPFDSRTFKLHTKIQPIKFSEPSFFHYIGFLYISLCQKGVLSLSKWLYTIISASESSSESPIANLNSIRVRALAPGPLRGKIAPHWKYIYCQWLFFLSYRGAGIRRFNGIQLLDLGISIRWVLEVYIRIFVRVKNR